MRPSPSPTGPPTPVRGGSTRLEPLGEVPAPAEADGMAAAAFALHGGVVPTTAGHKQAIWDET